MNKTILKYTLYETTTIEMPIGSIVLSVHEQHGKICLWALVSPDLTKEKRKFVFFGTGHDIRSYLPTFIFIGSVHLFDGDLVFHVFEVPL